MTLAGEIFRATVNSSNGTLNADTTMTFASEDESGIWAYTPAGPSRPVAWWLVA